MPGRVVEQTTTAAIARGLDVEVPPAWADSMASMRCVMLKKDLKQLMPSPGPPGRTFH